jgi:8-oxo-dGTP pyrophosphatase MutT (NUDIX family)
LASNHKNKLAKPRGTTMIETLRSALRGPLPGPSAWERMTPVWATGRGYERSVWRDAAVLVLLHPLGEGIGLPLLLRTEGLPHHRGQIGLPGGARESGEDLEETALRETEEELGVPRKAIEVLGHLSRLRIARSGFSVLPFVGWAAVPPSYRLQETEVAALIEAPLSTFLEPGAVSEAEISVEGESRRVPCYRVLGRTVWGATAMILSELASLLATSQ